ncbi:hypothetical protein NQ317_017739 [Molorchus minor]|uniref:Cytochrome P450 n=1 Tax=Molorchus minor TaxID=1323400 RepID=A0ABQ9J0D2_9CUCU|nr:hypothetical protein NQ317_017739 [Molorchus minor]
MKSVPYIEAVLLEVQRYCTIVPISGPRRVLRDTVLEGYTIPKKVNTLATAVFNFLALRGDVAAWGRQMIKEEIHLLF